MTDEELLEVIAQAVQEGATELDLSGNELTTLPPEIGQLTSLKKLILGKYLLSENGHFNGTVGNQLSDLPQEIGKLTDLQSLDLSFNKLSNLPAEIGQLTNLQSLSLSGNRLSNLPAEIGQLTNLQSLSLSGNRLSNLLAEIGQLTNLKSLSLSGNRLSNLPAEIIQLTNLQSLNLSSSNLSNLPAEIIQLTNLQSLNLDFNKLSNLPAEIVQLTNLQSLQLGFNKLSNLPAEIGQLANLQSLGLSFNKLINLPAEIVQLRKLERLDLRLNPLPIPPEILSGEKINGYGYIGDVQEILYFYFCVQDPDERVRSAIENYNRNYISLSEYYQLCQVNHLTDRKDMLRLSRYLHDLGVCLHFQDDPTLKHYVILKPEWGTTAVYKVLENHAVRKNQGCFSQDNLADIWQDGEYAEMQDELLQLMMRFKLCYPIPNCPGNYIAPQLLEIEQPAYNWNQERNLILRYQYDFMPKGILTRFIVETHPWIEQCSSDLKQQEQRQDLVWRSGVILYKDQTRAEVIENYNQREIKIRVTGNRTKELLTVVTHELEKIHRSFERLQYQTLVPCNCSECRDSKNPYSYALENLQRRIDKGQYKTQCEQSYQFVDVRRLIDNVNLPFKQEQGKTQAPDTALQQELVTERQASLNFTFNINSDDINQSRNANITGGTVNNSGAGSFNLGDIDGTVANEIN